MLMIQGRAAARVNQDPPSGSLGVKVSLRPVSSNLHDLDEVVKVVLERRPRRRRVRTRLLHELDERRKPKTGATVNPLLDRYLETLDVDACSLSMTATTTTSLDCRPTPPRGRRSIKRRLRVCLFRSAG